MASKSTLSDKNFCTYDTTSALIEANTADGLNEIEKDGLHVPWIAVLGKYVADMRTLTRMLRKLMRSPSDEPPAKPRIKPTTRKFLRRQGSHTIDKWASTDIFRTHPFRNSAV